jgi:hypothetical protein
MMVSIYVIVCIPLANNVSDRPRPGQPRVTTDQQDRHIRLQQLRNRFKTAASTARETLHFDVSKPLFDRLHSKYRNRIRPRTTLPAIFALSIGNGF